MKNIFIIITLMFYAFSIYGQECGQTSNGITTHPDEPISDDDCPTQTNTFDWRTPVYDVPYYIGQNDSGQINSPFFEPNNIAIPELWYYFDFPDAQDMLPEDGWELIVNGITEAPLSTTFESREIAYLVLYNKYTSILRVLAAHHDIGDNDYMAVHLEFLSETNGDLTGLLFPTAQLAQPLDKKSIFSVHANAKIPSNSPRYFFYADFPVAYDPCTCIFDKGSLHIKFEAINEQQLSIYGRSWAIDNDLAAISGGKDTVGADFLTNVYSDNDISEAGSIIFNSWNELSSHYSEQQKKATVLKEQYKAFSDLKKALDFAATFADLSSISVPTSDTSKFELKDLKNPFKLASKFVDVLSAPLKKKADSASQAVVAAGKVRMIQTELALSGSITDFSNKDGFIFLLPGRLNNDVKCNDASFGHQYPKYDEVLGRFALMNTPEVKIGQFRSQSSTSERVFRFQLDRSTVNNNYLFNPAAHINVEETQIYAALVIKATESEDAVEFTVNAEQVASLSNNQSSIFVTPFVPFECLSDFTSEVAFDNGRGFPEVEVQLRLLIFYEFVGVNSEGLIPQSVEVLTYPLQKVPVNASEIPYPPDSYGAGGDNGGILKKLDLGTNHYTSSKTISALDTIEITGDQTAAPGVEVQIIAPTIIVKSGTIGSGIKLKPAEFPIDCQPLSLFDATTLESYCKNGNYSANNPRSSRVEPSNDLVENNLLDFTSAPNPFTHETQLSFSLLETSEVSIMIYNTLGQQVKTVLAPTELPEGEYNYTLDGSNLPTGVYYATIRWNGGTKTLSIMKQ